MTQPRGRIDNEYTIWCGACQDWHREVAPSKRVAVKRWHRAGWCNTRKQGWVCPHCRQQQKTVRHVTRS